MFITGWRAAAALAIIATCIGANAAALAQLIPPSAMPGRERERFVDPPPPLSQPGGSVFSTPTYSPSGAIRSSRHSKRHKAHATPK
jgi:hypothetical protein